MGAGDRPRKASTEAVGRTSLDEIDAAANDEMSGCNIAIPDAVIAMQPARSHLHGVEAAFLGMLSLQPCIDAMPFCADPA